MTFTSKDIAANRSLKNFLRTSVRTDKTKLIGDYLFNVYKVDDVIELLKQRIEKHSKGSNVAKYIPMWKENIKYLESMKVSRAS